MRKNDGRIRLKSSFLIIGLALIIITWIITLSISIADRTIEIDHTKKESNNLVIVLEKHIGETFLQIENSLFSLRKSRESGMSINEMNLLLNQFVASRPDLFNLLSVIDRDGNVQVTNQIAGTRTYSGDRPFFIYHKIHPDRNLHIEKPVLGRVTGKWYIPVSVRLENNKGEFSGILLASVNPCYFSKLFHKINFGTESLIYLGDFNGIIYSGLHNAKEISLDDKKLRDDLALAIKEKSVSKLSISSGNDGVNRIWTHSIIKNRNMLVSVVFSLKESLQGYRYRLLYMILVQIIFSLFIFIFFFIFNKSVASIETANKELDSFFSTSLDLLCIADSDGNFIRVNKQWEHILGYSVADLEKKKFLEFVHPDDMDATLTILSSLKKQEQVLNFTNRYRCKDGGYRFIEWRSSPHGNLIYAAARDITERKRVEDELLKAKEEAEENETRFKALHNASFGGITIHDKGIILDCNQGLSEITGYSINELIGMNGLLLISEKTRDMVMDNIKAGYEKPYEAIGVRKNGEEYPLRLEAREIPYRGKRVRTVEFRDITNQKKAEEKLRETNEKLNALFSSMTEMVVLHDIVFDEDGVPVNYRITDCNTAFTKITGITREIAVGTLATDLYKTSEPPYFKEYLAVAISGAPYHYDTYFPPMDKHFSISVVSPGINKFATITTDITSWKQIQQIIEAKNKELEQIVYVTSHDLRSPLVNVDGYSRELEYSIADITNGINGSDVTEEKIKKILDDILPDMGKALHYIRNSTRQMDALLKGLLKLSRIGRAALDIKEINMNDLMVKVKSSLEYQIQNIKAEIIINQLPPCKGDFIQITQVFSNLIGNALKYSSKERLPVITISGNVEQFRVKYCVEDNGIGIPEDQCDIIFELFHRLDPRQTEGEGLGLTIVKNIVNRLDGVINVESKPGIGSKFFITLPFIEPKEVKSE
ncbi:MAG: hypothetical protein A2015_13180 [Spirochaetes bacterium GWF1_31_7]|nr:MAG: hypothetical protein A2Y30_00585 [Spirochaetes bacterium GWE1_32_154]OHD51534.1 MAG: hypothetical protein A2015_13180 [Spirochaetes bacterium GWF1_31_7]OHD77006.1 MAG: hypothetical protein A2355_06745 [Spirochaetes bacterium RIFOXYB1_FULL_32_8]HBD95884.1 hypothetical protein [Spirochaetia bacterium]HBI38160.1 hypothetical protein [Spirochaetia bacterium]